MDILSNDTSDLFTCVPDYVEPRLVTLKKVIHHIGLTWNGWERSLSEEGNDAG